MRPLALAALALAVLPLAGCLGGAGDGDTQSVTVQTSPKPSPPVPQPSSTTSSSTTASVSPAGNANGNVTGNGTVGGNATGNATGNSTWRHDNRTGTVAGSGLPLLTASYEAIENITVANGTLNLTLAVNATGDDLDLTIHPPGCDDEACAKSATVADGGNQTFAFAAPAEGEWSVTLSVTGSGAVSCDYGLAIAQLVPGNGTAAGNRTA